MSTAHRDSATGRQWHIRYRHHGESAVYWSAVYLTEADALASLEFHRGDPSVAEADLYIRDTTPWRKV